MQSVLLDQLGTTMREVSALEITPRFQKLTLAEVIQKPTAEDPTDLVTAADRAAEARLTELLPALVPGSRVVGEEAVAADPSILGLVHGPGLVWLVDPVDGTRNFAAGHGPFGMMIALIERGVLLASAIFFPEDGRLFCAERGQGAFLDGERVAVEPASSEPLGGSVYSRFLPADQAARLEARAAALKPMPEVTCAAHEYTEVMLGKKDYVVYFRLNPWDHAPGALIVREAGGVVRHPDGRDYHVFDERELTLVTPDPLRWERARRELFD